MIRKSTLPFPLFVNNQSGYTLFLVLELLIIVMVLFSIMLNDIRFCRVFSIREVHRGQSRFLAESGVARAEYFLSGNEGRSMLWESDGFVDSIPFYGKITIVNKRYGLFSRIVSSGTRVRTTCRMSAIAGRRLPELCRPVLTLHGKVGGVALMPGSTIQGTVVLSHGRICRGETTQEYRDKGLTVKTDESTTLPFDSSQAITVVKGFERERAALFAAAAGTPAANRSDKHSDSAAAPAVEIVDGDYLLESGIHSNRTIVARGAITITGSARCIQCRFSAKKVSVDGGSTDKSVFFSERRTIVTKGNHDSQFFGCDSMVIGGSANFGSMSLWMLWREGRADSTAAVFIEPGARVRGTIICCSDTLARRTARLPSVVFGKGCSFTGVCMSDGDINLSNARIAGHLWVRSIFSYDNNRAYVNYLFDVSIKGENVPIVFPMVGTGVASVVIEKLSTGFSVRKKNKTATNVETEILESRGAAQ
jgi:hypothetical protein